MEKKYVLFGYDCLLFFSVFCGTKIFIRSSICWWLRICCSAMQNAFHLSLCTAGLFIPIPAQHVLCANLQISKEHGLEHQSPLYVLLLPQQKSKLLGHFSTFCSLCSKIVLFVPEVFAVLFYSKFIWSTSYRMLHIQWTSDISRQFFVLIKFNLASVHQFPEGLLSICHL